MSLTLLVGCAGGARSSAVPSTAVPTAADPSSAVVPAGPRATWPTGVTELSFDDDLRYTCGTFTFEPAFLTEIGNAEAGDDPMAVALREHLAKAEMEIDWLPDTGWSLVRAEGDLAEFIAPSGDGRWSLVILERGPGGWEVDGWSGCGPRLVFPDGLGAAEWRPNSDQPEPNPRSRTIEVLVTERSCASGRPSVGRVVGPAVRYEADRVLVAFGVIPQAGDSFECPGNPPTPAVIELTEPLGDRVLVDVSSLPYVDVRTLDPFGR
jgi:hypothetical protein